MSNYFHLDIIFEQGLVDLYAQTTSSRHLIVLHYCLRLWIIGFVLFCSSVKSLEKATISVNIYVERKGLRGFRSAPCLHGPLYPPLLYIVTLVLRLLFASIGHLLPLLLHIVTFILPIIILKYTRFFFVWNIALLVSHAYGTKSDLISWIIAKSYILSLC